MEPTRLDVVSLASMLDLLDLRLTEYRDCFIRQTVFDPASVDQWLEETGGDVRAVENVLNHVHLYDEVGGYIDDQLRALEAIARRIAEVWQELVAARYPDRQFEITVASEPDEYGPTVSVVQAT